MCSENKRYHGHFGVNMYSECLVTLAAIITIICLIPTSAAQIHTILENGSELAPVFHSQARDGACPAVSHGTGCDIAKLASTSSTYPQTFQQRITAVCSSRFHPKVKGTSRHIASFKAAPVEVKEPSNNCTTYSLPFSVYTDVTTSFQINIEVVEKETHTIERVHKEDVLIDVMCSYNSTKCNNGCCSPDCKYEVLWLVVQVARYRLLYFCRPPVLCMHLLSTADSKPHSLFSMLSCLQSRGRANLNMKRNAPRGVAASRSSFHTELKVSCGFRDGLMAKGVQVGQLTPSPSNSTCSCPILTLCPSPFHSWYRKEERSYSMRLCTSLGKTT